MRPAFALLVRPPRIWRRRSSATGCAAQPASTAAATSRVLRLADAGATERLGRVLGSVSCAGCAVLLHGEPGAGKTTLARGFVRAACGDGRMAVPSPTFLLAHEYPHADSGVRVYHVDLWRLRSAAARPLLDFDAVFARHVSLIEWPDRLGALTPDARLDVYLEYGAPADDDDGDDPWGFERAERAGRVARLEVRGEMLDGRLELVSDALSDLGDAGDV